MENTRKEMRGPSFNMNNLNSINVPEFKKNKDDELRKRIRERLNNMSNKRMGYHAQSVSEVKREKWEEKEKIKEEEIIKEEEYKLEKKREKNRLKKKKKRERDRLKKDNCRIEELNMNDEVENNT